MLAPRREEALTGPGTPARLRRAIRGRLPAASERGPTVPSTTVRIAMNGVTGRMGHHQHLVRSLLALRDQGGRPCPTGR